MQIIRTDLGLDLSVAARVANANMPYAVSQKKVYFFFFIYLKMQRAIWPLTYVLKTYNQSVTVKKRSRQSLLKNTNRRRLYNIII